MALRNAYRPATLKARLNRLERELRPYESPEQRAQRAMTVQWLAASEDGAGLLVDLEDMREQHGATGLLRTEPGRALTMALMDSLYEATTEALHAD